MNFNLSEEQNMLKDSVSRFVRDNYQFESRKDIVDSSEGFSRDYWSMFAELGWLSIPFPEDYGGYGGSVEDIAVVMEEMGKGIVIEPFMPTVLMFGGLLSACESEDLKAAYIPRIIDGTCLGGFAFLERQSRYEIADTKTTAMLTGSDFVINGEKTVVYNGACADSIVVTARTSGSQYDRDGITCLLVDTDAAGIDRTSYSMMDGQKAANICFNNVRIGKDRVLGSIDGGIEMIEAIIPQVSLAVGAEALGIMATLNDLTVNYAKTRNQFGVPISSFQVLQHRMVDNFMAVEQARSMLYRGLCSYGEESTASEDERLRSLYAMRVVIARSSKQVGEEAVQIHGGMGMTNELNIGHFLKRLITINTIFGDGDFHQKKFNQLCYSST